PPPEMRIFAPIFFAASIATTRARFRAAAIAAMSPAAPAPMTATSYVSESGKESQQVVCVLNRQVAKGLDVRKVIIVVSGITAVSEATKHDGYLLPPFSVLLRVK